MIRAKGQGGWVVLGHEVAAQLGPWHVTLTMDALSTLQGSVEASVVQSDAFWRTQGPFDLVLEMGASDWRWLHVRPDFFGTTMLCRVAHTPTITSRKDRPRCLAIPLTRRVLSVL